MVVVLKVPQVSLGSLFGYRSVQKIGVVLLLDAVLTAGCEFVCLFGKRGGGYICFIDYMYIYISSTKSIVMAIILVHLL